MRVQAADKPLTDVDADLLAVLVFDGDELPEPLAGAPGSDDVKGAYRKTALLHPESPRRALVVGLGDRDEFEPERARVAGAIAARQAGSMDATSLALAGPESSDARAVADAMVEGAILASYRFDRFKSKQDDSPDKRLEEIEVIGNGEIAEGLEFARIAAEAENFARELQDLPANVVTPSYLAGRAEAIAEEHASVSCEVMGRKEIADKKMGGLVAVSQGTAEDPRLIVLRYQAGGDGETLGLVGKGVTFDTGGISIKPAGQMHEMKMDMSGAAAVLEAVSAIAKLELPVNVLAVIPSTENMPSGTAVKPGDIITQLNGKTVEVNNTDAEGRLILADALAYSVELGADRIVDLATLTGAVIVALGSTYAGADLERRRAGRRGRGAPASAPASSSGACRSTPSTRSSPRALPPTSPTPRRSARPRRSTPAPSWRSSWTAGPGPISTSPAPPGTSGASTSARARPATGCACWSSSPVRSRG